MSFIETVAEEEATGAVAAMYETDREVFGYLPNFTRGYSQRPDVYAAWRQLRAVRSFFSKTLDGLGIEPDAQLSER